MNPDYTNAKIKAGTWLAIALLGLFLGFQVSRAGSVLLGFLLVVFSSFHVLRNFSIWVRLVAAEAIMKRVSGEHDRPRGATGLPLEIFSLLYSVAEVDGEASQHERDLVRRFVLERFLDPAVHSAIQRWDARAIPPEDIGTLVAGLRSRLSRPECETIFYWCALVTLIDRSFSEREHEILQAISGGFGIPPEHSKRLFQHAKYRILSMDQEHRQQWGGGWARYGQSNGGGWSGGSQGQGSRGQGSAGYGSRDSAPPPIDKRLRAYEILGLESGASQPDIRKRHRELVKKFHPDAHNHLGEVAAKEATERFREIQEAYETLRS